MRNMKKVTSILVAGVLALAAAGCGSNKTAPAPAATQAATTAAPAATESAVEEATEATTEAAAEITESADGSLVDADAAAKAEHVITWCDSQPASSLLGQKILKFGEILQEKSDGRLVLQFYPSAMLGNGTTCMQQVQLGDLDIYRCDAAALYDFGVDSEKVISLPYLFKDRDSAVDKVKNSDAGQTLLDDISNSGTGFQGIGWFIDTPRRFFVANKEVHTLDDLKGLKIRAVETAITLDYKAALGMNPVPLSMSEVYTAFSTGVIDAAANTVDSFTNNKFDEVCHYIVLNNGMIPCYPVVFSQATWGKFSAEDQQLIIDCLAEASSEYDEECVALEEKETADLEAKGVKFCEVEDEDKWAEACQPIIDKYGAGYEDLVADLTTWGK